MLKNRNLAGTRFRLSTSEDDGQSWSELSPVGDWGGIVVMGFVE